MIPRELWQAAVSAYQNSNPERAGKILSELLVHPAADGNVFLLAGLVEMQLCRYRTAEKYLLEAVERLPESSDASAALGNVFQNQGRAEQALPYYQEAVARNAENFLAWHNMGVACQDMGRVLEALECFDKSLSISPGYELALRSRAALLRHLGRAEQAEEDYKSLIALHPRDVSLKIDYAEMLEKANLPGPAAGQIPQDIDPEDTVSRARVAVLRAQFMIRKDQYEDALELVRKTVESTGEKFLLFNQGMLLDRLGRYEQAIESFRQANRYVAGDKGFTRIPAHEVFAYLDKKIEIGIPPAAGENAVNACADAPVFITGLPRSGTTLLNRILDAHPKVQALEEIEALRTAETALDEGASISEGIALYWQVVKQRVNVKSNAVIIDKNPYHAMSLDVVAKLFPQSRVIYSLRHPYDAALSCFMQDFLPGPVNAQFLSLKSSAGICARFLRLMLLFETARADRVTRVYYEDLVENFRPQVERVLKKIGLDWHDDIEKFNVIASKSGLITTSSYEQVTRKLYDDAVFRWKNYRPWLDGFDGELSRLSEQFGYSL